MSTIDNVEVHGMNDMLANLENKLGSKAVSKASKEALKNAAIIMGDQLEEAVSGYIDTGATVHEIVIGKVGMKNGARTISIGWDGDGKNQRYRLVHLNEFGYTRWGRRYSPSGMGKIKAAFDRSKAPMRALEKQALEK